MSTEDAWNYHSTGAAALIKLRGPERCQSDFEKALLLSHVGQIVTLSSFPHIFSVESGLLTMYLVSRRAQR